MILRTEMVEQAVDDQRRVRLVKEVIMTDGDEPLGMVRKRLGPPHQPKGVVVLVHGFGQNRYTWHTDARSFSAFLAAEGWDVFNVDLRGHGRSRRFGSARPEVFEQYVRDDLPAFAREAKALSGADRVFLIGHSMGGLISYAAAASSVRRDVRGVATIGSPYHFGAGSRLLEGISAFLGAIRFTGVFDSNPSIPLRLVGSHLGRRRSLWDHRLFPMPIRPWSPGSVEHEVLDDYLRRAFDWTSAAVALEILRAGRDGMLAGRGGRTDYRAAFEWLNRPLLVVAGSRDALAPAASVKPAYDKSHATDKSYRLFPMGHIDLILGRSAPTTVWPLIANWLERRR